MANALAIKKHAGRVRLLLLALLNAGVLCAADASGRLIDPNFHGWYNYFGDHPIGDSRWGIHLEGQWRRSNGITRWQQSFLRPAVNYQVSPRLILTGGYAFADTFRYGDFPAPARFPEHRLFQQAQIRSTTGKVVWSTRLRFENRFLGVMENGAVSRYRYENRFRFSQRLSVPVRGRLFFTTYNEIFFFVPPYKSSSALDQNRAYAALGWRLKPGWSVETGYVLQNIFQRNGRIVEANNTMIVSLVSSAPFRRHKKATPATGR